MWSWVKGQGMLVTKHNNNTVQLWAHCNWQFGSIFIAKLQIYWVWRPTNNCHQIATKCTKSHMEFQNFSGCDTPGPPSQIGKVQRWQPYSYSRLTRFHSPMVDYNCLLMVGVNEIGCKFVWTDVGGWTFGIGNVSAIFHIHSAALKNSPLRRIKFL